MVQRDMTPEEMRAHLREPLIATIATIATVKRDGSPQLGHPFGHECSDHRGHSHQGPQLDRRILT